MFKTWSVIFIFPTQVTYIYSEHFKKAVEDMHIKNQPEYDLRENGNKKTVDLA